MLISLLALAPLAQAQWIFICKDASGKTLTSDRPIPECADRAVKQMDRSGIVRREIAAPLTAEQRRQKQAEEEKKKAEEIAVAERKQADRAILARYRNEGDIETARKRTIEMVHEQIKRESASLAAAEQRKKEAHAEAAKLNSKSDITPALAQRLEESDAAVAGIRKKIREYEIEAAQLDEKFAATLKRYRELNAGTANAAHGPHPATTVKASVTAPK